MHLGARIYVAGGDTMIGRALLDRLHAVGYHNLVGEPRNDPDLLDREQVEDFFRDNTPEYVIVAAGASGGIAANVQRPADLMLDNLLTITHVIEQAHRYGARKLLYLASSCSYPKHAPQPLHPESLLSGPLEETNDAYALAKLAGWKLCNAYRRQHGASFITAIPANPFGRFDDFRPESGHVIPALLHRMHEAKLQGEPTVTIWGSGRPRRDFLSVLDLADACLFLLDHYDDVEPINVGSGSDWSIAEIADLIAEVVDYRGRLVFDPSKPDGMPRKALDSSKLTALGWKPTLDFRSALEETYSWYLSHHAKESIDDAPTTV